MHRLTIDLTGQTYGQLRVLAYAGRRKGRIFWTCKCLACGSVKDYQAGNLRSGASTQCFHCPAKPRKKTLDQRHHRPGYRSWKKIIGSGEACKRWLSFEKFIADMGEPSNGKRCALRIDFTKPYSPENCVWAAQPPTRFLTHNGQTKPLRQWAQELGLTRQALYHRLKQMSLDEALTKPRQKSQCVMDLAGQTFGQLLVLADVGSRKKNKYWRCKCLACGSVKDYEGTRLRSGQLTQCFPCPAKRREIRASQTYQSWKRIVQTSQVCARWRSFRKFIADMGEPPEGKRYLVRIDLAKPYQPGNCTWSPCSRPRLLTHNDQTKPLRQWAQELGLSQQALHLRLKKMSVHEALTRPMRKRKDKPHA